MDVAWKLFKWWPSTLHCYKEGKNFNDLWWPWPLRYGHQKKYVQSRVCDWHLCQKWSRSDHWSRRSSRTHRHTYTSLFFKSFLTCVRYIHRIRQQFTIQQISHIHSLKLRQAHPQALTHVYLYSERLPLLTHKHSLIHSQIV